MSTSAIVSSETLEAAKTVAGHGVAACNPPSGSMTTLFFSEDPVSIARAKHICQPCPLKEECLTGAIKRREPNGVWGGHLISDGRIIAYKRRRGRPPRDRSAEHIKVGGTSVLVSPAISTAKSA